MGSMEEIKEPKKHDFESREYQVELFEMALKENLIIFLPTGSGKTYIATLLIKEFNKSPDRPISTGGKRTFFLVNTQALAEQQSKEVMEHTCLNVGVYTGSMMVDLWNKETWEEQVELNRVLVMTTQIFVDIVQNNIISLKNVNLIVFDECHRAVSNHPMAQVMANFKLVPDNEQPRVVGLTATLINKNITASQVEGEIRSLERTMISKIGTSLHEDMVKMYSTNPKECKKTYIEKSEKYACSAICDRILHNCLVFVDLIELEEKVLPPQGSKPANTHQIGASDTKKNKELKNLIKDIVVHLDELGLYGGQMATLAHLVQLINIINNAKEGALKVVYREITTELLFLRKVFNDEMNNNDLTPLQKYAMYSSPKVHILLKILKKMKSSDFAIIFVKRRFTAKVLYYILKEMKKSDPQMDHIKTNFIVGYNIGNPLKDTREGYVQSRQNKVVMNQFNQGELNVLIASNVVEEGIDITQCNFVVMFDLPCDFRSYVQSKGRARDRSSNYILMIGDNNLKFSARLNEYRTVEQTLKEILYGGKSRYRLPPTKEELDDSLFAEIKGLEPYRPKGVNGPVVTALTAISVVNRYLSRLDSDKFSKITPFWWLKVDNLNFKCFLQLPLESTIKERIEGTWQSSKDNAKRSVALETCKILYQIGEINDNLLPPDYEAPSVSGNSYTPNFDADDNEQDEAGKTIGTKKTKSTCLKKWADCLCECRPQPNEKTYVYVLEANPLFTPPKDNHRLQVVHQTYKLPNMFALLTSKKLPQLAPFTLFTNTGEMEAQVRFVCHTTLSKEQLNFIIFFHCTVFDDVLGIGRKFMVWDHSNTENSYLIAPVTAGASDITIDWEAIKSVFEPFPSVDVKPSHEDRRNLSFTRENYLGKIVSPWYRTVPLQKYLVTNVCFDMSENTKFPTEIYSTYKDYFENKYKIVPLVENQPLLEVKPLSSKLNCTKPRSLTQGLKKKSRDGENDGLVMLLPEYCVVYPFDGKYWVKALLLPSFLHRISQLCIAEELRCKLVREIAIGTVELPPGSGWQKLVGDTSVKENEESEKTQALTPLVLLQENTYRSRYIEDTLLNLKIDIDMDRELDTACTFDLFVYNNIVKKPLLDASCGKSMSPNQMASVQKKTVSPMVEPPPLQMLKKHTNGIGPQQVDIMQALTVKIANDIVDCERLETLGDSFLKFAVSLALFEAEPDFLEGRLTHIKGKVVGNKNLYFCGTKKNLAPILELHDFLPNEDWVPPGLCVDRRAQNVFWAARTDPSCLYTINIPAEERRTGVFSEATDVLLQDKLLNAPDVSQPQNCPFINQAAYTNKNIADAVEALLGTYLQTTGIFGALAMLNWFGITSPKVSVPEIFTRKALSPMKGKGNCMDHLLQPEYLEDILHYKFKDRNFLLQALTHPTYSLNNITTAYQRLEFLGDALIDFLITVHIFEKCKTLTPGDLTDLRSALVNNITLAALTVRNQFHKFVLHRSKKLDDCIIRFVRHQEQRNHVIDDDILFLLEERDMNIAEAIDVPKTLGDVFEAIIGAVYLDSGKNIDVVWKIVYNLMKNEIESFSKKVPKNHVRMLYESQCAPTFSKGLERDGNVLVSCEIVHDGRIERFNGVGENKHHAKRAAAKHALRFIRLSSNKH